MTQTSIRSGDVVLRPWSEDDLDALVGRINDPDIASFLDRLPQPYTEDDAREWFRICTAGWADGRLAAFGIHVDDTEGAIGGIGINFLDGLDEGGAEVGYWVAAEARGRGIATAATRAAAAWVFAEVPELARLQLRADVENVASNRVAERAGFTREGILRAQRFNARLGRRSDFAMWSLLREEL
ncbi:MAG: GNAT family N-acetyltransferase [Gaiellaceae bacterium]